MVLLYIQAHTVYQYSIWCYIVIPHPLLPRIPRVRKLRVLAHFVKVSEWSCDLGGCDVRVCTYSAVCLWPLCPSSSRRCSGPASHISKSHNPTPSTHLLFTPPHHHHPHSWQLLAKTFLSCMLWGLVMQFMSGYFFLHSWNNLFGELLRFADRQFYSVSPLSHTCIC